MPTRTINEGFVEFHRKITPGGFESGKAASHKSSITRRLEDYYELKQLFYSGSANNGTDVAYLSDVDFFASIPGNKLKENSATSLREIKECLQDRYPRTHVYVDSPAVVLDFGSGVWDTAEVIPAHYQRQTSESKNVYDIPDGTGGWMKASPNSHNAYVAEHNDRLGKKLKPLIRFLKAWKYYKNVPISSFYLELKATRLMESETSIIYSIDLAAIVRSMNSEGLPAIRDPKGVSGLVQPCPSPAARTTALSRLATAASRAEKARTAESDGRIQDAFDWWDLLFDGRFPSRYYR